MSAVVVLDANILIADYHLASSHFVTLSQAASRFGFRVVVPSIVMDELQRNFLLDLEKTTGAAREAIGKLRRVTGELVQLDDVSATLAIPGEPLVETYMNELRAKFRVANIAIADYPKVSHQGVMARLVARRKPFKDSGVGYADALIWETVVEVARASAQGETVYFLSQNSKDFADPNHEKLADELEAEARAAGMAQGKVVLVSTLKQFNEEYLLPLLAPLQQLIGEINSRQHPITQSLLAPDWSKITDLSDKLVESVAPELGRIFNDEILIYFIDDEVSSLHVVGAQELNETRVRISFEGTLNVTFDSFIDKSDLWQLERSPSGIEIWQSDWNKWSAWAAAIRDIQCLFSAVIDLQQGKVEAISLDRVISVVPWNSDDTTSDQQGQGA